MDHQAINNAIARLSILATDDVAPLVTLRELCEVASVALDVDGVGIMVAESDGNRFAYASSDAAEDAERLQEQLQSGPCRDAADSGRPVIATDDEAFSIWPDFGSGVGALAIGAMAAIPLMARQRCWGVLDLYRRQRRVWTTDELDAVTLLASVATSHLVMAADRDAARAAQVQLAHQSNHDHLTGLANRSLLFDRLEHALALARRHDHTTGVLFLDLDRFKSVNDTHGHPAGDLVLQEVARRLTTCTRDADTVARLSGDEFVVVCDELPHDRAQELLDMVVTRIHQALQDAVELPGGRVDVSVSIGTAIAADDTTVPDLLAAADQAMYRDKR